MFIRTLRFLKLPNRDSPYRKMPSSSRNKNKVSKENAEVGYKMEIMNTSDIPEPSNFVEIMTTDTSTNAQDPITDEGAGASATAAVEPLKLDTETIPRTNSSADVVEFTQSEVQTLWRETLSALLGMLNDGDVHPCYRQLFQVERCCDENNTNTNHSCYERWRDGVAKRKNSM